MASENKMENVMLTGQTAYFKKSGSMTNYGVLNVGNQETSAVYGPGYVAEGSVLQPAVLETSADYVDTEFQMQTYLGADFTEETDDYTIKTNAEKISDELGQRTPFLQDKVDNMGKYKNIKYLNTTKDILDIIVPVKLKPNFVLQIYSNLAALPEEYILVNSDAFRLWQNNKGQFFINDIELPDLTRTTVTMLEIVQQDDTMIIKLGDNVLYEGAALFDYTADCTINIAFAKRISFIRVYGDDLEYNYTAKSEVGTHEYGLYDNINGTWYPTNAKLSFCHEYECANIWSGAIDLGYCPGPNTGIEITYRQYSSQSSSTNTFRNIIGCYSNYSKANTMSFGLLVGSGSTLYACRNNNQVSWINSGVISSNTKSTITMNKHNDGRFIGTGGMVFNVAMSGTATIQNKGNATLWLNGANDLGRYIPCDQLLSNTQIPMKSDIYIYNIKIYEGTQLVRDYVVATDLDNTSIKGMYDKVENKMYRALRCSFSLVNQLN